MQATTETPGQAVEDTFTVVQQTFATLDSLLRLPPDSPRRQELHDAVQQLSKDIKVYKKKRAQTKSRAGAQERVAWLNSAGVQLWNRSTFLERGINDDDADGLGLVASARLVALSLLELGVSDKSSLANLYRLLGVVSKTVISLMRANRYDEAKKTLLEAADYQGMVERLPSDNMDNTVAGQTLLQYYFARIKVCIAEDNHTLAEDFAQRSLGLDQVYGLGVNEYRLLANECWETGTHLRLTQETESVERAAEKITAAMRWLDVGRKVLEAAIEKFGRKPGYDGLERALLSGLIRCHLWPHLDLPDAVDKANELLGSLTALVDLNDTAALHELGLIQLSILRRQDAPEDAIKEALHKVILTAIWTREGLATLICEINQSAKTLEVRNECFHALMQAAIRKEAATPLVMTVLLALVMQSRQSFDADPQAVLVLIRKCLDGFPKIAEVKAEDSDIAVGVQSVLWTLGEKTLNQGAGGRLAAECFEMAAHPTLIECGGRDASKCLRKGAMCLIEEKDVVGASRLMERCASDEASTHYIRLLIALRHASEDSALQAIDDMVECADLDGRQLVLASRLAESEASPILHIKCLEALVLKMQKPQLAELGIDGLLLVRSLVKTILGQIISASEASSLLQTLNEYLSAAHDMVEAGIVKSEESLKSLSWLCKTAYNATSLKAQGWDRDQVANLFDTISILIVDYQSLQGVDTEMSGLLATSSFACMCGHLLRYREMDEGDEKTVLRDELLSYLPKCRAHVDGVVPAAEEQAQAMGCILQTVNMAEIELLCEAKQWGPLELFLQRLCGETGTAVQVETLESISDLLSRYPGCPQRAAYGVLEALLRAMAPVHADDVAVFAKWTKASLHVLLSRDDPSDDKAAAGLVMRVVELLKSPLGAEHYPLVHKEWLFATLWNRGLELNDAGRTSVALWWANRAFGIGEGLGLPARQLKECQEVIASMERAQESEPTQFPPDQNTPQVET